MDIQKLDGRVGNLEDIAKQKQSPSAPSLPLPAPSASPQPSPSFVPNPPKTATNAPAFPEVPDQPKFEEFPQQPSSPPTVSQPQLQIPTSAIRRVVRIRCALGHDHEVWYDQRGMMNWQPYGIGKLPVCPEHGWKAIAFETIYLKDSVSKPLPLSTPTPIQPKAVPDLKWELVKPKAGVDVPEPAPAPAPTKEKKEEEKPAPLNGPKFAPIRRGEKVALW